MFPPLLIALYSNKSWFSTIIIVDWSGGQPVDSCGKSTCPKTPEEAFFASLEAKAVPAESVLAARSGNQQSTYCAF
ncbi:hypothetical protein D8M05_19045 [Oceanobacillus bengalensis]|uniref:Uncharacterized protein n=1 Tax=Oceanobacillus bengalensis TaxID=1435466 RepID=A0A494YRM0_9BACI|nr:hypothetical protein D8M05_19045 [Oceanobacillus bengalensis]